MSHDLFQHPVQIPIDLTITDPQSSYSHFQQRAIALRVVLDPIEMRVAVYLNSELRGRAIEIGHVSRDYLLSPEVKRIECVLSECVPQDFLLRRHPLAQISCELQLLAGHKLVAGYFHLSPNPTGLPFWRGESVSSKFQDLHAHLAPSLQVPLA